MILKNLSIALLMGSLFMASCSNSNYSNVSIKSELDTINYYLGYSTGLSINTLPDGVKFNRDAFIKGFIEGADSLNDITVEEIHMRLNTFFMELQQKESVKNLEEGQALLEKNKSEAGVVVLDNGIQYKILTEGSGAKPDSASYVKVHYHGTLFSGEVFDSSVDRGEPVSFPLANVIVGWQKVMPLMPVGSKWKVWIPTELAYGENVRQGGPIKPNMPLIFEIELLGVGDDAMMME